MMMTVEPEFDYADMAAAHSAEAQRKRLSRLVVAGRRALETWTLPPEEQAELDAALEQFSSLVPYDDEPAA